MPFYRRFLERVGLIEDDSQQAAAGPEQDEYPDFDEIDDDNDIDDLGDVDDDLPFGLVNFEKQENREPFSRLAPIGPGNAWTNPIDAAEARRRYAFIESICRKHGVEEERALDAIAVAYSDYRRRNRIAYYDRGQIEGWRFAALVQEDSKVSFLGVEDNGLITSMSALRDRWDGGGEGHFDWSFSDPLSSTKQIISAWKHAGDLPGGMTPDRKWEFPFIIQSSHFRRMIDRQRGKINHRIMDTCRDNSDGEFLVPDWEQARKLTNKIAHTAKQDEIRRLGAMTNAFMRSLDPEVQKTMRSLASYSIPLANYFTGVTSRDGEMVQDPDLSRNRIQAVRAFPLFADKIVNTGKIEAVVDEGGSLVAALSQEFQIDPKKLKKLQGVTWQKTGREYYREPKRLARMLKHLDINHIPRTRRGFADLAVTCETAAIVAVNSGDRNFSEVLQGVGGRFDKISDLAEGNPPSGIEDMCRSLRHSLFGPALAQELVRLGVSEKEALEAADSHLTKMAVLDGISARNALQNSARWHRNEASIRDELEEINLGDRWNALAGAEEPDKGIVDLGNGIHAVELNSTQALKEEGVRQNHCVGGYSQEVLDGYSAIFSIREKGGKILSTVEFSNLWDTRTVTRGGQTEELREIRISQNYGHGNSEPPQKAQNAAKRLQKTLNSTPPEKFEAYLASIRKAQEAKNVQWRVSRIEWKCGFNPLDRAKLEAAWNCLGEYLPRGDRKKGLDGWLKTRIGPVAKGATRSLQQEDARFFLQ